MRARSVVTSSSLRPSRNSWVCSTATRYSCSEHSVRTQGAAQRLMSNSRQGRDRSPVITSLQDLRPNSLWLSDIALRASDAGMKGPA